MLLFVKERHQVIFTKKKTETFYDIELAVEYAKTYDTEKDYSVTIQEVSNIIEWQ